MGTVINLVYEEWFKMKRSKLWLLVGLGPIIGILFALFNFQANYHVFMNDKGDNEWLEAWTQVQLFYSPLILPVMTGIYASMLCRMEHVGGGWKQLMALPIKKSNFFISKLITVFILLALTQCLLLIIFVIGGFSTGLKDTLPLFTLISFIFKGWIASLPLATAQLALSIRWRQFGAPLGINIALSLPSILIANSSIGQFYPWAQPMLAMSPIDESPIHSMSTFYLLLFILFIVMFSIGVKTIKSSDLH